MADNKFIFLSPKFDARAFVQFLQEEGKGGESFKAILDSYNELKSFYWKGDRSSVIKKGLNKLSIHSIKSSFIPTSSINGYILDQYYSVIYYVLLYLQNSSTGELSSFLGVSYEDIKEQKPKPVKKNISVPLNRPEPNVTYSRGFHIRLDVSRYEEYVTQMLLDKGVDASVIPGVINTMKEATKRIWYHVNSSYKVFKLSASDIDKYVDGLYYDNNGKKEKPDDKTKQAIKHLIECYQIEHPYIVKKELLHNLDSLDDDTEEEDIKPRLIVSLDLVNKDQFIEFLKNQQINRQTKERYTEEFPFPKDTSGNSNRSTFIEQDVTIDTNNIRVYVNGEITSDIICRVREYKDAYVVYLFYRGNKSYTRSFAIEKEAAQEPIRHIRYNEADNTALVDGKKLAVTLQGYDDYKRKITQKPEREPSDKPTDTYFGKPSQEHKTLIAKQTTVVKTQESVEISIKESPAVHIETNELVNAEGYASEDEDESSVETPIDGDKDSPVIDIETPSDRILPEEDKTSSIESVSNVEEAPSSDSDRKQGNQFSKTGIISRLWAKVCSFFIRLFN